jgi:hypothetical protein
LIWGVLQVYIQLFCTQQSGNLSGTVDILFYHDFLFLQLSENLEIADPARCARASLAIELSSSAKGKSRACTAQYLFKALLN